MAISRIHFGNNYATGRTFSRTPSRGAKPGLILRRAARCNSRTDCGPAVELLKRLVFDPWPGASCQLLMTSGDAPGPQLSVTRSGRIATAEPGAQSEAACRSTGISFLSVEKPHAVT